MKVPSYLHLELVTARRAESIVRECIQSRDQRYVCLSCRLPLPGGRIHVRRWSRSSQARFPERHGPRTLWGQKGRFSAVSRNPLLLMIIDQASDTRSLAKMAMLKVLSKKASRMKIVVDLLSRDVGRSSRVGRAKSLEAVIDKGIAAIEGARY